MLDLIMGSAQRKRLQAVITNDTGTSVLTEVVTQIQVTASGGTMYEWDGGLTPLLPTNTFIEPGTYTVTVRQSNGIPATASIIITQETPPTPEPEFDVYIDPDNTNSGRDGSLANPYQSITEAGGLVDNTSYGFRAGSETVLTSELSFANRTNTLIGVYGVTELDYHFKLKADLSGTCAVRFANSVNCTLMGFDLYSDLSNSLVTLIQGGVGTGFTGGSGNIVTNFKLHGAKQGTSDGGMGFRIGGSGWQIVGGEIYDIGCDGIYVQDMPNCHISHINMYRINMNYAGSSQGFNSIGNSASGDGIQFSGNCDGFYVGYCNIDRSDAYTGNKFNIIANATSNINVNQTGVIEHNYLKTQSSIPANVYIEKGSGIIVRYNTFEGAVGDSMLRYTSAGTNNNLCHHNIFKNGNVGVRVVRKGDEPYLGAPSGTEIYNNVFYNISGNHITAGYEQVTVRNNIHALTGIAHAIQGSGTFVMSNNAYTSSSRYNGSIGAGANAVVGDIKFVDAPNGDFHLASDSPCRNAGYNVGLTEDFDGVTIPSETVTAIGAFEYVS